MNTFGQLYRITTFGESHGKAIGGVIDGMPPGIAVDLDFIQHQLDRRRPGQSRLTTARKEADRIEILSGTFEGRTTGQPIGFVVYNTNQHSSDYENMRNLFRPSHADFTYTAKYGIRDHRGGGRASARETASRVVAGSVAQQLLKEKNIHIHAELVQVGSETNPAHFEEYISNIRQEGDSIGGIVQCTITGLLIGVGEPIFDKLQSHLAFAMMSINGCKGFEYGSGFEGVGLKGSEMYLTDNLTLISGGIAGGISDGTSVVFRCVFKPTASNRKTFEAIRREGDEAKGTSIGRHDACIAVRAVAVVEAMAALVLQDIFSV